MIIKAEMKHIPAIAAIYEAVHDREEAGMSTIGWIRGIYPTRATAEAAYRREDLYVQTDGERVVGAAVINQIQPEAYAVGNWTCPAEAHEVLVLHTLVIDPAYAGHGYGRAFVQYYECLAREQGMRVLRIDTNARNLTARGMYAHLGYHEAGIVPCEFNGIPDVSLVLLEKVL